MENFFFDLFFIFDFCFSPKRFSDQSEHSWDRIIYVIGQSFYKTRMCLSESNIFHFSLLDRVLGSSFLMAVFFIAEKRLSIHLKMKMEENSKREEDAELNRCFPHIKCPRCIGERVIQAAELIKDTKEFQEVDEDENFVLMFSYSWYSRASICFFPSHLSRL